MSTFNLAEQHVLAVAFEEDLRARIQNRRWYRKQSAFFRPYLTDMERENTIALRALLKLRSSVRRASRTALRIEVQRTAAIDAGVEAYMERVARDADAYADAVVDAVAVGRRPPPLRPTLPRAADLFR